MDTAEGWFVYFFQKKSLKLFFTIDNARGVF